ncbi:MAG: hypothetical protein CMM76_17105 [Rhodospirillaceae bacterium]|nr:hypothetical protein [Rhodospirillaceae bacterium]
MDYSKIKACCANVIRMRALNVLLIDMADSKSPAAMRGRSSPPTGTIHLKSKEFFKVTSRHYVGFFVS